VCMYLALCDGMLGAYSGQVRCHLDCFCTGFQCRSQMQLPCNVCTSWSLPLEVVLCYSWDSQPGCYSAQLTLSHPPATTAAWSAVPKLNLSQPSVGPQPGRFL
jgi:hypothetical protein